MKIVKILPLFIFVLFYSCSEDNNLSQTGNEDNDKVQLSILINNASSAQIRTAGDPDSNNEKNIYSLDVLIFNSQGSGSQAGMLDVRKSIERTLDASGKYITINEVTGIPLSVGKRYIYVVANAPTNYFAGVNKIADFLALYEKLDSQSPLVTELIDDGNPPIGGAIVKDPVTNLTMCHFLKDIMFDSPDQYYLGYTGNGGRPGGVSTGKVLNEAKGFLLERLVARVAIKKIDFDFPAAGLEFDTGTQTTEFTYQLDSVFLLNARTTSSFPVGTVASVEGFGHGTSIGYSFIQGRMSDINSSSQLKPFLAEAISSRAYNISNSDKDVPLWFYTFENTNGSSPTYFVIGVRYYFPETSPPTKIKTLKCYYPVLINGSSASRYIKRNTQYALEVKIKGLGLLFTPSDVTYLKSAQIDDDPSIEITQTVGENLFPWTGNVYK